MTADIVAESTPAKTGVTLKLLLLVLLLELEGDTADDKFPEDGERGDLARLDAGDVLELGGDDSFSAAREKPRDRPGEPFTPDARNLFGEFREVDKASKKDPRRPGALNDSLLLPKLAGEIDSKY